MLLAGTIFFEASGDGYPYTGEMRIVGTRNASIRLIALDPTNVRIEADYDGDGATDMLFINACFPPGNDGCAAVLECILACGDDGDCAQDCFDAGSEDGRALFNAFAECINDNACQELECPECMAQLNACNADR